MSNDECKEQVAIVTGGASGIGRHTVQLLAEASAHVVIVDRDAGAAEEAVSTLRAAGLSVSARVGDVTVEQDVNDTVAETLREHGRIDILVNNAGTTVPSTVLWETPPEVFEQMWRVHLFSTYLYCRAVVPAMTANGYGRIVNVASVAGKEGNAGSSAYSSAKAAAIGLTKSLGKELATSGVLVNVVTPGVIRTPLVDKATPEHIERLTKKIPMGRVGEPDEVAELIFWLASPRCGFSTGAVFDASGGRTTY
ncbi:MAG: 3-oxoacyl-ACP reductase [Marmoricola sp.]|nr:3-oxoacyl-ACP reductase [Marmoricola sp.]